jgi:galactokinase
MPGNQIAQGRAPGRIDFLGGVADYSGAWVLETPINGQATVSIAPGSEWTFSSEQVGRFALARKTMQEICAAAVDSLAGVRRVLDEAMMPTWGRYVIGCLAVLIHHGRWPALCREPWIVRVESDVPLGMGVSSSAAIEVATLRALSELRPIAWSGTELARFAQQAENEVVGAPCGLMDQLTAAYGQASALLPILCRPDQLADPVRLPPGVVAAGWPSGVKHNVGASPYATARRGAFMGKKIVEEALGRTLSHLSALPVSEFPQVAPRLPGTLTGREFVTRYGLHDDPLTALPNLQSSRAGEREALDRSYPVKAATAFPVEESDRVQVAIRILREIENLDGPDRRRRESLELVGGLLLESHEGYGRMGLGSPETDEMVAAIMELGPDKGLYGTRISGGGSGGTVVVLLEETALAKLESLRSKLGTPHPLIRV